MAHQDGPLGGIAQFVERCLCKANVSSSSLLITKLPRGCLTIFTLRDATDHSRCGELGFSNLHNMILLDDHPGDRQKHRNKNKRYPGCLAHAVVGMFYSVVAFLPGGEGNGRVVSQRRSLW